MLQQVLEGLGHCRGEDDARYDQLYSALLRILQLDKRATGQTHAAAAATPVYGQNDGDGDGDGDDPVEIFVRRLQAFKFFEEAVLELKEPLGMVSIVIRTCGVLMAIPWVFNHVVEYHPELLNEVKAAASSHPEGIVMTAALDSLNFMLSHQDGRMWLTHKADFRGIFETGFRNPSNQVRRL